MAMGVSPVNTQRASFDTVRYDFAILIFMNVCICVCVYVYVCRCVYVYMYLLRMCVLGTYAFMYPCMYVCIY